MRDLNAKFIVSVAFAAVIVAMGFYTLVLNEFEVSQSQELLFASLMTLAVKHVFDEASSQSQDRRTRRTLEAAQKSP